MSICCSPLMSKLQAPAFDGLKHAEMQVTIVAKIQSVKDASSGAMMKMVVYDGTGSFNVEHYMPQDDEQVPPSLAKTLHLHNKERCSIS